MDSSPDRYRRLLQERVRSERLFGIEEIYVGKRAKRKRPAAADAVRPTAGTAAAAAAPASEVREPDGIPRPADDEVPRPAAVLSPAAIVEPETFEIEDSPAGDVADLLADAERAGIPSVANSGGTKAERLAVLSASASVCTRCPLCKTRTKVVFGEGNPEAKLVFVGEAPGADEDATGRPFVGRAGKLLTKIIEAMGFAREDVFICNVLKCRPPNNRPPSPDEIVRCSPFLHEQLAVMRPAAICALGGPASTTLLDVKEGITHLRGRFFRYRGIPLMPTFHPAYLLRNMNEKRKVWEDMKKLLRFLAASSSGAR
jgi:uracil-DNA glycosylase family 4